MKWQVKRREQGDWGIRLLGDTIGWHDSFDTHAEAIVWARRNAVIDQIFDGALAEYAEVKPLIDMFHMAKWIATLL